MICKRCGKDNEPNARFCEKCGAPMETQRNGKGNNNQTILIVIIIVLLVLLAAAVGIWAFTVHNQGEDLPVYTEEPSAEPTDAAEEMSISSEEPVISEEEAAVIPTDVPVPAATEKPTSPKKNEFLVRASEIEEYTTEYSNGMLNQTQLNQGAYTIYEKWDDLLNEVYQYLKTTMSDSEFESLRTDERAWIKEKDAAVEDAARDWAGGTGEPMVRYLTAADYTKERTYYLISLIE